MSRCLPSTPTTVTKPITAFSRAMLERVHRGTEEEDGGRARAREGQVPGSARTGRPLVSARERPARTLGARDFEHHPRRGLLLRAADADQNHERRLGLLLALQDDDR